MSSGKYLSIDIGRRNIQLVVGRSKGNTVDVETWLTVPTPEGSVKEGNLIDRNAIAFAIRNALKDHRIGVKKAIVIIKSAAVITRELTIPNVTDRDLMPLVLLDMEQYVPNIAKDYRTGVTILEKISGTGQGSLRVRVFAMTNAMADSYADLLKSCDLKPAALDVQANALNKLVQRSYKLSNDKPGGWSWKLAAFVDLGFEQTEIDIFNPEKLVFNRQIPYGSSFLDAELMRQMGFDDTNLNLKKIELCDLSRTEFDSDEARRFHDILRLYVSRVTNELSTVIQFYSGRVVEKRPEQIYIYGGNAHLKGLAATMEKAIGIPVQVLEDCPAVHANAKHQPLTVTPYVNAIAALARND